MIQLAKKQNKKTPVKHTHFKNRIVLLCEYWYTELEYLPCF